MLSDLTAKEVRERIVEGDGECAAAQDRITKAAKERAREERLECRQKWAADKKKLTALLAVLEIDEPVAAEKPEGAPF